LGNFRHAITSLESILTTYPDDRSTLYALSESYYFMGQRDAARIGFQRLLQLDPQCEPATQRLKELAEPVKPA
jgi:tetratricopeptide (TPR) repeat protein